MRDEYEDCTLCQEHLVQSLSRIVEVRHQGHQTHQGCFLSRTIRVERQGCQVHQGCMCQGHVRQGRFWSLRCGHDAALQFDEVLEASECRTSHLQLIP